MTIACDLGAYEFRTLRRQNDTLLARSSRSGYILLPDTEAQRRLLHQARFSYATSAGQLVLVGDAAAEWSRPYQVPMIPLLSAERSIGADPLDRQILRALLDALLPEPGRSEEPCCLTISSAAGGRPAGRERYLAQLSKLVRHRGYTPVVLHQGQAVVLAELVADSFTGIGLNCGAGGCDLCLAHCGTSVVSCSIPHGGNWIDEQLAAARTSSASGSTQRPAITAMAAAEEKLSHSAALAAGSETRWTRFLQDATVNMLTHILSEAGRQIADSTGPLRLPQPLPIVCAGGVAQTPGFPALVHRALRKATFPLSVGDIRVASQATSSAVRGCLINAELSVTPSILRDAA